MVWTLAWTDGVAEGKYPNLLAQFPGPSRSWQGLAISCSSVLLPNFSHSCTNTLPEHRDTIHRDLWAQVVCLMGKRRHPILPLAGPHGLWTVEKLLSKAIRSLLGSGLALASPWPSEGLWSVSKQHEDGLHPGTLSYSLTASSGVAQTLRQSS